MEKRARVLVERILLKKGILLQDFRRLKNIRYKGKKSVQHLSALEKFTTSERENPTINKTAFAHYFWRQFFERFVLRNAKKPKLSR